MKKKFFAAFAVFHLLFIAVSNLCSSYVNYCEYYDKPADSSLLNCYTALVNNTLCTYYAKYTGANTGYGYFAPNVRTAASLDCSYNGTGMQPAFRTKEASLRYENMVGSLIENVTLKYKPSEEWQRKAFEVKYKYNELIFKNIAVAIFNAYHLPPSEVSMKLCYIDHVPLKEARAGKQLDGKPHIIQETKFTVKL